MLRHVPVAITLPCAGERERNRRLPDLALENLALRQQLVVLRRSVKRPRLQPSDRLFWSLLKRFWRPWRETIFIVKPDTVVRWRRAGFRRYWTWRSHRRRPGRPAIDPQIRSLIRRMSEANPLWGAPRIHGELMKLGIEVSEATISNLIRGRRKPPSQTWRAFLDNHLGDLVSIDFFTVPTTTFRVLFVFVVLRHDRRRVVHGNVTEHSSEGWTARQLIEAFPWDTAPRYMIRDRDGIYGPRFRERIHPLGIDGVSTAPRSPWQNPFVERLIGSIRRECLDHVIVLGERHLIRILRQYCHYYHECRTHLSLEKDAPESRPVEFTGKIVAIPKVGGLHHRYVRRAA